MYMDAGELFVIKHLAEMPEADITKNPFARPGSAGREPIDGKEAEFYEWARQLELERRKTLPPDELKALEASERALDRRMNS